MHRTTPQIVSCSPPPYASSPCIRRQENAITIPYPTSCPSMDETKRCSVGCELGRRTWFPASLRAHKVPLRPRMRNHAIVESVPPFHRPHWKKAEDGAARGTPHLIQDWKASTYHNYSEAHRGLSSGLRVLQLVSRESTVRYGRSL
ncbi:hypothetical protein IG631_17426 [Alternaria alternata]|nr:hypothetical protein IG631_17426 [Alternaria alternata]